jgi:hypothetical protein
VTFFAVARLFYSAVIKSSCQKNDSEVTYKERKREREREEEERRKKRVRERERERGREGGTKLP